LVPPLRTAHLHDNPIVRARADFHNAHIAVVLSEQVVSMLDVKIIAHECWHATARILYYCDVRYDVNNPEPFAYLHGFVFAAVLKAIKVRLMYE